MARVMLTNVRLCFPHIFVPQANTNDKGEETLRFSAAFLIDPKDAQVKFIVGAMREVAREKWGAKGEETYNGLRAADRLALHDGATKASDYPEYAGMLFINAGNSARPLAIDGARNPVTAQDGLFYPGCFVNAKIELWAQDRPVQGKRINAVLSGLQFAGHGDSLGGAAVATVDDFEVIDSEGQGDDWGAGSAERQHAENTGQVSGWGDGHGDIGSGEGPPPDDAGAPASGTPAEAGDDDAPFF